MTAEQCEKKAAKIRERYDELYDNHGRNLPTYGIDCLRDACKEELISLFRSYLAPPK